jgi:glutaredoxin-like protein NrdH
MIPVVEVFSRPGCVQCKQTDKRLDARGITYTETNVEQNDNAREFVKGLGYLAAPVVVIRDRQTGEVVRHWSGFRPDDIDSLAPFAAA